MRIRELRCRTDAVLLVEGPATVKALDEGLTAIGVPLQKGNPVLIRTDKVLPIETDRSDVSIIVKMGDKGKCQFAEGKVGIRIWKTVEDRVFPLQRKHMKAILIGGNDSGKSTLTTFLINTAMSMNLRTAVIDTDVGQGDLGPPGSIGAALVKTQILDLRDLRGDYFGFVGITSPNGVEDVVINEAARVQTQLEKDGFDFCVINTDGYVGDIEYKVKLTKALDPDLIICMKNDDEDVLLNRVLYEFGTNRVIQSDRPQQIAKKPLQRSARRLRQYQRYLRERRRVRINLNTFALSFFGIRYTESAYCAQNMPWRIEKKDDRGNHLVMLPGLENVVGVMPNSRRITYLGLRAGLFLGLGSQNRCVDFGIIEKVYLNGALDISTPARGMFDTLFLGVIHLSADLRSEHIVAFV